MSLPKEEVKKHIEKNTILVTQEEPVKRHSKLIVRFSPPKPLIVPPPSLSTSPEPELQFPFDEDDVPKKVYAATPKAGK